MLSRVRAGAVLAVTVVLAAGCATSDHRSNAEVNPRVTPSVDSSRSSRSLRDTPEPSPSQSVSPTAGPSRTPVPSKSPAPAPRSLAGKVIVIDPGHNAGNYAHGAQIDKLVDSGNGFKACDTTGTATYDGYTEAAFTRDVAQRLATLLVAAGAKVVLTVGADTEWGPCITDRARIGNEAGAAVAVSIHADGGPDGGTGFHVMEPGLPGTIRADSHRLAIAVRDAYRDGTGMRPASYIGDDGLNPRTDMGGLNLSRVPKVMLEAGNMRNSADAARLKSADFRQRAAQSLVTALSRYLS